LGERGRGGEEESDLRFLFFAFAKGVLHLGGRRGGKGTVGENYETYFSTK
jgi:hypothetical protein